MRKFFLLALMAGAVGMASMGTLGCGDGGSGGSGGGNGGSGGSGGGNGGDGGAGASTGNTTGGTTTISLDCTGQLDGTDCGNCLETQCCGELTACLGDADCADCIANPNADPAVCNANAQIADLNACGGAQCSQQCLGGACDAPAVSPSGGSCVTVGGAIECNPVTNEPCGAGEACDNAEGGFVCYPDGNVHSICEPCGNSAPDGQYCQGGLTCIGICARYCCDDTDCGSSGKCTKGQLAVPEVGFCEAL